MGWWIGIWDRDWGIDAELGAFAVVWAISLVVVLLAVAVLIQFFFLRNLRDLLERVSPHNRAMRPGQVWLNFIPLFGYAWMIYTVIKVRDSLKAEYRERRWWLDNDLAYGVGMAFAVLQAAAWALGWIPTRSLLLISSLLGVGGLVCWIVYWVKTGDLKHLLSGGVLAPRQGYGPYPGGYPYGPETSAPAYEEDLHCLECGESLEHGDQFCRLCGQPTSPRPGTLCSACGLVSDPSDRFCRSCGGDLP